MLKRCIVVLALLAQAVSSAAQEPSEFHVVSIFFSDNGALFYYRVTDVQPYGRGSRIQYTRVAPSNVSCPRLIVQSAQAIVVDKTPAQLAGLNNPCRVKPAELQGALKKYKKGASILEAISFGIGAKCGDFTTVLGLPIEESIDLPKMRRAHPEMVRLWTLSTDVINPAFGEKDLFHNRSEEDDLLLQRAGQALLPDLTSGKFDKALTVASEGMFGNSSPGFRSLLAEYRGPVSLREPIFVPKVVNASANEFQKFSDPVYPALARQARIQGTVELQLTVDSATGAVLDAQASGHRLLTPSALAAAKTWRFATGSLGSDPLRVSVEYSLKCP